ncbi:MAG TPA: adenylate/guanylate cyclase domain-containing protein, partial [Acidimicrobiales bacterium]|nr:adenylate/guanylate cyclase domain-containing protein [Acidimicrobiales bacterium]
MAAPSGTVTFLFTDIEGSTRLWESAPDEMRRALALHDEIMRDAIGTGGGHVFATGGDGFAVAFERAGDAVAAALDAQRRLAGATWPDNAVVRVRMGLHSGEAEERNGDYFGTAVNRAARLMAIAHGGQVVCSQATASLLGPDRASELRSLGEHRLRDLGSPEAVCQVGDGRFPPLRSVDAVPTNLPTVRTELIGRSEELTSLCALVERQQLVTLTGVGGVGKTRLALGVAGVLAPRYPDGCWLVELAPVADGSEVTKVFAAMIAAPAMGTEALGRFLADRRLLVVLDNCEHVIGDAAELVDTLLGAAPDLHVLATSREPLGLDGEHVRRVQSLGLPAGEVALAEAAEAAAVRLFVDRAAAVGEGFALTEANRGAVVEICRHLDGIPLAIELAAARVRAMPPAEIATRLGERFRLLTGGSRRAQERHRTLAATVGWSYDLLSDAERAVFRRLSVFPASFDLAAAEAVAGDGTIEVLDHLVRLVDRSLVQYEPATGRYRLLETLRQYGADRLAEAGETDATRARHGGHFIGMAASLGPQLHDGRYPAAVGALTVELDNLRAVADWCMENGRATELARLGEDVWMFVSNFACVDGAGWYRYLSEAPHGLDLPTARRAGGYFAFLAVVLGDYAGALAAAGRALDGRHGPSEEPPWAWLARSMVGLYTTRDPSGPEASERALAAAEAQGDETAACVALGLLGAWLAQAGDLDASDRYAVEGVERAQRTGNPELVTSAVVAAAGNYLWTTAEPDFA